MTSHFAELRRCRPLLGTFVEIGVRGDSHGRNAAALEAGFAAIERVHHLMSFHNPHSDVSCLNRDASHHAVEVSPWTFSVLEVAERLHQTTDGVFDLTVAPLLQRRGFLPRTTQTGDDDAWIGGQGAIELLPSHRVRFHRALRIDLGGIAKGFAVDRAVGAMRDAGAISGIVNAGGDLRAFGAEPARIHVRDPRDPGRLWPLPAVRDGALATSARGVSSHGVRRRWVAPWIDPKRGRASQRYASVSVRAATCTAADALTKVVHLLGRASTPILVDHAASAIVFGRSGELLYLGAAA